MSVTEPMLGPVVDATPRPLPARVPHRGARVDLEPLHVRHLPELWHAAQADQDSSWAYLACGPFPDRGALRACIVAQAAMHDPMFWAIRPHAGGTVEGWLSLMSISAVHADIELGNIWFGPRLRRTRAATEAMFILMSHAMDDLGYRRLVWKCNALNEPSRRAAARLGFTHEGTLRNHMIVKGRSRDTAWFSTTDAEWPARRDAIAAWLDPANFDAAGNARAPLRALPD